uniref:RING-CH-type domain-containing protein n=1 Tax=Strongyloides venezuelensis TaxID=75913 RepID=A0A0K0FR82_STRVS
MNALGGITNIDILPQNDIELYFLSDCYTSSTSNQNDKNKVDKDKLASDINCINNDNSIVCRFCFSGDELYSELGDWITPCKCSGSMKFVHRECFNTWMSYANNTQRYRCRTCSFTYVRIWKLKPLFSWTLPKLNLSAMDVMTIIVDIFATSRLYDGCCRVLEGKKSLVLHGVYCFLYKNLVFTRRRIGFYISLFRNICLTIFTEEFANAT